MDIIDQIAKVGDGPGVPLLATALALAVATLWRHTLKQAATIDKLQEKRIADLKAADESRAAMAERVFAALEMVAQMNTAALRRLRGHDVE